MALNRKIAYIDLDTETITFEAIPMEWRRKFVGGRGLDAYLLYTNTAGGCDPLGPDNVVVISAGLLGGTLASSASRTHIAAKSPLTDLFGSASMGGFFAPEMRWAGIDHFVIRGKANRPVYIFAHDGEIEIRDADHLWGAGVYDAQAIICKERGDEEIQTLCIGPAGENLVRYASIITGRKDAAARTGMGAVLGSKNLKALACRGTMEIEIYNPEEALEYNKKAIDQVISSKASQSMQRWGTNFMFGITNTTGLVRTR
ncbi:MAG: aldehyde ferredoxin oxidoreductase N-terminal domain-containing protein, partial [Desulfobacterales bacterium]